VNDEYYFLSCVMGLKQITEQITIKKMKLLVGLGNYPAKYDRTRHNVGFLAVEQLAKKYECEPFKSDKKFFGQVSVGQVGNEKVILLKPETYMNLSGKSVQSVAHFYKIKPEDIVLFFDDVDLDFGTVRFRTEGSAGGHNGVKSVIESLGTKKFPRIKMGIANEDRVKIPTEAFVLQKFSAKEWSEVPAIINEGISKFLEKIPC
jgi:PTH1 family peptidyl-tRNA hydrolase